MKAATATYLATSSPGSSLFLPRDKIMARVYPDSGKVVVCSREASRNQGPFSREEERGRWERGCVSGNLAKNRLVNFVSSCCEESCTEVLHLQFRLQLVSQLRCVASYSNYISSFIFASYSCSYLVELSSTGNKAHSTSTE